MKKKVLPENPAYFSREARRIIHHAAIRNSLPNTIVTVDGHDVDNNPQPVARYAAYVSDNKGPVVPPDVYASYRSFLEYLARYGVCVRPTESGAKVSRSNDAAWMEWVGDNRTSGYDIANPHFNAGLPMVNMDGLIASAKTIAWLAAEMAS